MYTWIPTRSLEIMQRLCITPRGRCTSLICSRYVLFPFACCTVQKPSGHAPTSL